MRKDGGENFIPRIHTNPMIIHQQRHIKQRAQTNNIQPGKGTKRREDALANHLVRFM